jgi:hypothetical protein
LTPERRGDIFCLSLLEVLDMPFELFERKRAHGGPPAISISKNGLFVINASAIEKHFQNRKYATVYWDKTAGKVGIKPLVKREEKSYNLHLSPKGNVGSMSATAFLKYIGYELQATKSFPATWNEKEGLLEFTLFDGPRRFARTKE